MGMVLPPRVLIIDDDEIFGDMMSMRLKKRDFKVERSPDPQSALELVDSHDFDMILLDYEMPQMCGLEVLQEIRKKHTQLELPVIMVTASESDAMVVEALHQGANDYVTKPLKIEVAIARIKTQLMLKDYYYDSLMAKQLETLNTMVATYNHEINNPLTIAMAIAMGPSAREKMDEASHQRLIRALQRISEIVKLIRELHAQPIELKPYSADTHLFKLNKKRA